MKVREGSEHNVYPLYKDKYYVYALFKPKDFNPFYIGKGIGTRINNHFKASSLVVNNPKTGIIKKYGNSIRREILCYFDKESSAYQFEEDLIAYYGLATEGGVLANYAKTRFQFSESFARDCASKGSLYRETKYTEAQIKEVYDLYFIEDLEPIQISEITNIPCNYLYYVVSGKKWKNLYSHYTGSESFVNNRTEKIFKSFKKAEDAIPDEAYVEYFELVCSGKMSVKQVAERLGTHAVHVGKVFLGHKRKYLCLDTERYVNRVPFDRSENYKHVYETVNSYSKHNNVSLTQAMSKTGIARSSYHKAKTFLSKMEEGLNNGTGDSSGDGGDDTVNNSEAT